ncbi:hypothetical protein ABW19_dt0201692 [Dactylella cylindrospora]|nr:hypothetical protein ABW19_dt0201692 [Dactylella cylindrospora]
MGQGASSTRCPTSGESQAPQQTPSIRRLRHGNMSSGDNQDPPNPHVNSTIPTQSRRRSFSPDPDNVDSRRSARIRRRISRFVSPNAQYNYIPGRGSTPSYDPSHDSMETGVEQDTPSPTRVRTPGIRARLLHRRRSPANHNVDGNRRERPFSMLTPRIGSLPFSLPRTTGSFDLPQSHRMEPLDSRDPDLHADSEILTQQHLGDRMSESPSESSNERMSRINNFLSERGRSGPGFGPRRNGSSTNLSRPRHQNIGPALDNGSTLESPPSTETLPSIARPRQSSHRPPRDHHDTRSEGNSRIGRSGEDQATVLSRLLSVAAAATAASLVGSNAQALSDARDASGDNVDGSFESFLRALQNGRLASALRNGGNVNGPSEADISDDLTSTGSIGPLNFFRMFRFGATSSSPGQSSGSENTRMIPVIIVGIRSVTPRDGNLRDGRPSPPFLDALSSNPIIGDLESTSSGSSSPSPTTAGSSRTLARVDGGDTAATAGSSSHSPRQPERATRRGNRNSYSRPINGLFSSSPGSGSHENLFTGPFGQSSASSSSEGSDRSTSTSTLSNEPTSPGGHHIRGDSPPRPMSPDSSRSPTEGTRSWIIYVLGGSYPENHPILTTPSLFTDTPTYEDMMLLSSLIAPVKPPVASQEDVESAGGLFTVSLGEVLEGENFPGVIQINMGERCLVCLCDFENGEVCRQLVRCQHIFHRDCIDEWLTTGRNSCPLCRGKGVEESSSPTEGESSNDAIANNA